MEQSTTCAIAGIITIGTIIIMFLGMIIFMTRSDLKYYKEEQWKLQSRISTLEITTSSLEFKVKLLDQDLKHKN